MHRNAAAEPPVAVFSAIPKTHLQIFLWYVFKVNNGVTYRRS